MNTDYTNGAAVKFTWIPVLSELTFRLLKPHKYNEFARSEDSGFCLLLLTVQLLFEGTRPERGGIITATCSTFIWHVSIVLGWTWKAQTCPLSLFLGVILPPLGWIVSSVPVRLYLSTVSGTLSSHALGELWQGERDVGTATMVVWGGGWKGECGSLGQTDII